MSKDLEREAFTNGFNYSVKNGKMTLAFFCDCCGSEVKVEKSFDPNVAQNQHELFEHLKDEMDGKFHRCYKCQLIVCQECYEKQDTRCKGCTVCVPAE